MSKNLKLLVLVTALPVSLIGCTGNAVQKIDKKLQALELFNAPAVAEVHTIKAGFSKPPLNVGDVFTYDNPSERWEVVSIGEGTVDWHNDAGGFKQTTWSTLLPAIRWGSGSESGYRNIDLTSANVHPLSVGKKFYFSDETMHFRPPSSFKGTWDCEVMEKVNIEVAAGKADTWQVVCSVNGREKLLFNYADNIGGLVRTVMLTDDGSVIVRQLTRYQGNKDKEPGQERAQKKT